LKGEKKKRNVLYSDLLKYKMAYRLKITVEKNKNKLKAKEPRKGSEKSEDDAVVDSKV
jgi:hypothetical protein